MTRSPHKIQPARFGPQRSLARAALRVNRPGVSKPAPLQTHPRADPAEFCLVHLHKTKNNATLTLSRLFGLQRTLWTVSGGMGNQGKANGRRKSRWSQRLLFNRGFERLCALGARYLVMHVRGATVSKRYLYRHFRGRFKIVALRDVSGVRHNGCRPPAQRRK
jgi:small subunit ribosomal protein S11